MNQQLNHAFDLITNRLIQWYEISLINLPNLVAAFCVFAIFYFLSFWIRKFLKMIVSKSVKSIALVNLVGTTSQVAIVSLGLFISLGILNLDKTVTSLLAGAGVIGLALGFAFQDIASNFVSGVLIAFREPYKVGDIVEVDGYMGTVKAIDLRTTLIETFQGIEVYIPNKSMFTKPLQNISGTPKRRVDLEVGVSYAEDLRKVSELIKQALESMKDRLTENPVEVYFKEFGGSSINCEVRVWISYPGEQNFPKAKHEMIIRIKEVFDDNDISIPFPIRTLDFGIKGGETLKEPLSEVFSGNQPNGRA